MRFALYAATLGELADPVLLADLAAEAEAAGYDGFFISDWMLPSQWPTGMPVPVADAQVALALIARATSTLRIGAMVTPLPRRRPVKFAREVTSLDRVADGRLTVGAGSGHEGVTEFQRLGEDPDPRVRADRLDETLVVLDALLRGEAVDHSGDHLRVHADPFVGRRAQHPRPPIWIGASPNAPRALRRAARWDGLFALRHDFALMSPEDVERMTAYVHRHRSAVGETDARRSARPFDIALTASFPDNAPPPTSAVIESYSSAGATWWLEYAWNVAQARSLIRRGPGPVS